MKFTIVYFDWSAAEWRNLQSTSDFSAPHNPLPTSHGRNGHVLSISTEAQRVERSIIQTISIFETTMNGHFDAKLLFFLLGMVFLIISIFFHVKHKVQPAYIFMVMSAFFLFLFGAFLLDFLCIWDERFHALVGKNTMYDPLKPTLYNDPVVLMKYDTWDKAHVWLHKQPMFLWQIALSFRLFGVNVYALRLPSAILSTLLVMAGYRTASIIGNKRMGYYTGLLILSSQYLILLVSGYAQLDHNDVTFLAYISFSIWAWVEYERSKNKWWIIAIGIFSGAAVLTKWLVGLLVYLIWGLYTFFKHKFDVKKYGDLFLAWLVTVLTVLPWQLFILSAYPVEAKMEHQYNFRHLWVSLEGHGGPFTYHFDKIGWIFGPFFPVLVIPAFIVLYTRMKDKKMFFALIVSVLFVFLFFSFSATKMPSFTLVVALPVFMAAASLADALLEQWRRLSMPGLIKNAATGFALLALVFWRIDVSHLQKKHGFLGAPDECSQLLAKNTDIFKNLRLPDNAVLFNLKGMHYVEAMFYTGLPAYNFLPDEKQYLDLKSKHRIIAIFNGPNDSIPPYLLNDPQLILLNQEMKRCD